LQESYQQADRAIAKKTAHLHVLQNLQAKFEGFAEGAKSILSGGLGEIANESSVAIISKAIRVPQEYTLGLQTLLGMAVDALYIEDGKQSIRIIRELNEKQLGRVCLQIDTSNRLVTNQMEIPSHIVKVSSIVQISEQNLESTITKYLEGCYFAETLDEFINFWTENPDFQFTLVATKNGELIDARGLIYGGAESGKKSAGVLERSSEIQELEIAIADDRKQLNTIREKYEQVENQRNKATADVESLREALTELNKVSAAYESDVRAQKEKIERTVEARDKTESSLNQLDQAHSTLIANAERSKADLETAETAYKRLREDNEQCEKDITLVREHLETQRESLANVRLELAEKRQRLQSADEAIERAQGEKNSLEARISRRNQEINNIEEQIRKYKVDSEQAEAKAQEIELTQNSVLSELETNKAELKELDLYILSTDEGLSSQRNTLKASEKSLNEIEVSLAERRTKISFLKERIQTDYQLDLTTVDWQAEYWEAGNDLSMEFSIEGLEDFDLPAKKGGNKTSEPTEEDLEAMASLDWEAIEAEVNECKGRITSMGPVNVDSIGEYADLKERYDFLKEQSQDLWESKNLLVKSIDEINATSLSMFKETFDQVRENFIYTYDKLSGGGTSDLRLIDSEDPLESGIDIIARPPGTRLKNVTLLSGGQRTMTAVALLFAIYLVKPSPFCVLDEIDAALDDANIGRFCDTLRDFTSKSQFLIITHNKRTISNADTVFGVTMPEKGVSTLISMRFNKNDETQMISLS
jgi:chromosome segregation protein